MTSFVSRSILIRNILENCFYLTCCPNVMTGCLGFNLFVLNYLGITLYEKLVRLVRTFVNSCDLPTHMTGRLKSVLFMLKYRVNCIILIFYLSLASTITTGCNGHNWLFLGDFSEYFGVFCCDLLLQGHSPCFNLFAGGVLSASPSLNYM